MIQNHLFNRLQIRFFSFDRKPGVLIHKIKHFDVLLFFYEFLSFELFFL